MTYSKKQREQLLNIAQSSIKSGIELGKPLMVNLDDYEPDLQENRAAFVTLNIQKQLRGCIGSLQAHQPLVIDVSHNAFAAAFQDPRFHPLTAEEFSQVDIHISVLSEPEPMGFESEKDLLHQLRPGIDGLILTDGANRGTFLPAVWESFPNAQQFFANLKLKAGLPANYWSNNLEVSRYTAESIP